MIGQGRKQPIIPIIILALPDVLGKKKSPVKRNDNISGTKLYDIVMPYFNDAAMLAPEGMFLNLYDYLSVVDEHAVVRQHRFFVGHGHDPTGLDNGLNSHKNPLC